MPESYFFEKIKKMATGIGKLAQGLLDNKFLNELRMI